MKVIDTWLKQLHEEVGSDLFVTVNAPPCIKVHGKIKPISTDLLTPEITRDIVLSVMAERQKEQFRNTQELQFAYSLGPDVRYRMSAFVQQGLTGMVCRRIETRIPGFEELGHARIVVNNQNSPFTAVLVRECHLVIRRP